MNREPPLAYLWLKFTSLRCLTWLVTALRVPDKYVPGVVWHYLAAENLCLRREIARLDAEVAEDIWKAS